MFGGLSASLAAGGDPVLDRPHRGLDATAELELPKDVLDVDLDRALGDVERARDLLVAGAAGDEGEDLALARRERGQRRRTAATQLAQELRLHLRRHHRFAGGG